MSEEKPMLDHVSIGVRDLGAARKFYDAVLGTLGYTCLSAGDAALGYGRETPRFWISVSGKPVPAERIPACISASRHPGAPTTMPSTPRSRNEIGRAHV